jgi:hypothetical protein
MLVILVNKVVEKMGAKEEEGTRGSLNPPKCYKRN